MSLKLTPEDQRLLLETSFEPHGTGFLFYRHRWAKGVPVSAAERDEYLAIPVLGSRRAFYRKIKDRAPVKGEREYRRAAARMASALPQGMAVGILLLSGGLILRGFSASAPLEQWAAFLSGAAGIFFGLWIVSYRRTNRS